MVKYLNYEATVSYQDDIEMLMGKVINSKDIITFYANCIDDLKREMKISIDEYLKVCKEHKIKPSKAYSGKFNVRIDPDLHKDLSLAAARQNVSLNNLVESILSTDKECQRA